MTETNKARLALLPVLAERFPSGRIGRTALMKFLYFLQTVRGLPLGYSFSMYSYGPFDSEVLSDLGAAETLGIVQVEPIEFAGGYGYRISPGPKADKAKYGAEQFLSEHREDLDWLLAVFGRFNSAELEVLSTIVYVDREFAKQNRCGTISDIVLRVNEVKPRIAPEEVKGLAETLSSQGILISPGRSMCSAV
jgi:uncharacterized protein